MTTQAERDAARAEVRRDEAVVSVASQQMLQAQAQVVIDRAKVREK